MRHRVLIANKHWGFALNPWHWRPFYYVNRKGDRFWQWLCFAFARYSGNNFSAVWIPHDR